MADNDKIKMYVDIAGQRIALTVPFDRQDDVRDTEANIAALYDEWRTRFPKKSDLELLAMISYQYASYYLSLEKRIGGAVASINKLNSRVETAVAQSLEKP